MVYGAFVAGVELVGASVKGTIGAFVGFVVVGLRLYGGLVVGVLVAGALVAGVELVGASVNGTMGACVGRCV